MSDQKVESAGQPAETKEKCAACGQELGLAEALVQAESEVAYLQGEIDDLNDDILYLEDSIAAPPLSNDRNADLLRALFVAVAGGNWGAAEDALRNIASWAEGEELSALATCAEVRRAREQREADRAAFDVQQVIFAERRAELDAREAELDARIAARAAQAASL